MMTMHVRKSLEFSRLALVGVGHIPTQREDEQDEAQLFYVAATRVTQRLILWGEVSGFGAE